ncbi:hypothetical protein DFJ73DRAFT_853247 [Zopfochytrium polystomum]|nr:hypothetical protein DFJ73DRAFT_853247 [Zopfochytrium polystomum]
MSTLVPFKLAAKTKKIKITPSEGFDAVLAQVAKSLALAVADIELAYEDPADGELYVLCRDEDVVEVFSLGYKWKVVAVQNNAPAQISGKVQSPAAGAAAAAPAGASDAGKADEHDPKLLSRKELWADLISPDWTCKTMAQAHPFFISYRQSSDGTIAKETFFEIKLAFLQEYMTKQAVLQKDGAAEKQHAFLDAMCLSHAQKWGINLMSGIFHSAVVILMCSDKSMQKMLKADQIADNLLLEWELALQMCEEKGHDILPILLSTRVQGTLDDGRVHSLIKVFSTFDSSKFPDKFHKHPLSPGRNTVRQTIAKVLEYNGPKVNPEADVYK